MRSWIIRFIAALTAVFMLGIGANPQTAYAATGLRCYVDVDATAGTNDGDSWANAFTDLQSALGDANCTEVWVAEGVYKPTTGTDRSISFHVLIGVQLYGGFDGTEGVITARNPAANPTILSGDIDNNDTDTDGNHIAETYLDTLGSNTCHVLHLDGRTAGDTEAAAIDGFTVTAGMANCGVMPSPENMGGGLYIQGDNNCYACPAFTAHTITGVVFSGNEASESGGGLYCYAEHGGKSCDPTLTSVTFVGNFASMGGGMYNAAKNTVGGSSPTLTNVIFRNNSANAGGALVNDGCWGGTSSPVLLNVSFEDNHANGSGGAMYNYGYNGNSSPVLANVTFSGNSASSSGGAIFGSGSQGDSTPTYMNVTFHGNSAGEYGGAMYNLASFESYVPSLVNVILWGDTAVTAGAEIYNNAATPTIDHSVVEGGCPSGSTCTNLITTDPKLAPLADNGAETETMSLIWGSSAIDEGDDATCAAAPVSNLDQRGIVRPQGEHCDIGALERVPPLPRADFESDGISDMGYFHPATGLWGILESSESFSYAAPNYYTWGTTGDIVAAGDYDGDGRMDPTVRTPPAGGQSAAYLMLLSATEYDYGSSLTVPAGWPGLGDTPVIGDFNGDGISDPAIWRGNTGVWIIPLSPSFTSYAFYSWGTTGDTPIGADVDKDGQTDIGYWHPDDGVWGFLQSSESYSYSSPLFFSWGKTGDIPAMADYDGDHLADPAVVIPPSGGQSRAYQILPSMTGYDPGSSVTVPAGWPGLNDTPVPADYDGDGKVDPGIWRGNTGVWIIPQSSGGYSKYLFAAWGASGDQVAR
jgi:predicted outer membrane repeat protein